MTLGERQRLFMRLLPRLLDYINDSGYECAGGELERSKAQAAANAAAGTGIANSLHTVRLAIDLHLFKDGMYLTATEAHRPFGEFWEGLHPECRWGGRFNDGNHYSIEFEGRK